LNNVIFFFLLQSFIVFKSGFADGDLLFIYSYKEKVSKKKTRPNLALFPENSLICLTENG